MTLVVVVQIAYNALIYRQLGKMKWLKFGVVVFISLIIDIVLIYNVKNLVTLPYIKTVVHFIDTMLFSFFGYISGNFLLIWFVVPLLIIWAVFMVKVSITIIKSRIKFNLWKKQNKEDEIIENVIEEKVQTIERHEEKTTPTKNEMEQEKFLEDVPLVKIRFNSVLGLQRTYEVAKNKGLQVGENENGYVAVYSSLKGLKELKGILEKFQISIVNLTNRPSIVFFDRDNARGLTIKVAMEKLKAGEKID